MTTQNLTLFKAMGSRMDYLNHRQRVIAQNIANADTPGYRPSDLTKQDFSKVLNNITQTRSGVPAVRLSASESGRSIRASADSVGDEKKTREPYEVAPAGNAVVIEEQLIKAGRTVSDYNLMTNLYQKHVGMMRAALGSGS